jgi:hypothetical protein
MVRRAWRAFQLRLMIGAVRIAPRERGAGAPAQAQVPPWHAVHPIERSCSAHRAVANAVLATSGATPSKPCIVSSASRAPLAGGSHGLMRRA